MLGTVMPAPTGVGLNQNNKGKKILPEEQIFTAVCNGVLDPKVMPLDNKFWVHASECGFRYAHTGATGVNPANDTPTHHHNPPTSRVQPQNDPVQNIWVSRIH